MLQSREWEVCSFICEGQEGPLWSASIWVETWRKWGHEPQGAGRGEIYDAGTNAKSLEAEVCWCVPERARLQQQNGREGGGRWVCRGSSGQVVQGPVSCGKAFAFILKEVGATWILSSRVACSNLVYIYSDSTLPSLLFLVFSSSVKGPSIIWTPTVPVLFLKVHRHLPTPSKILKFKIHH